MLSPDDYNYLRKLEQDDDRLKEILDRYERDNTLILSRMNHEIRNPLTLINSTMQLMSHKAPELNKSHYWLQMNQDMKDLFSLLDDMSRFTHSEELKISDINLIELLTQLKISFEPFARQKNATINIIIKDGVHNLLQHYQCDQIKIKQVFTNLIKNAIESIDHNHGSIQIILDCDQHKDFFEIHITDNGIPIPKENLHDIFTPFFTTKSTGSGLGLPTVKRIVESHGGTISATSDKTLTDFLIRLPINP